jgi:hypothetical protein
MAKTATALVLGLTLLGVAIGLTLSRSPMTVAASNKTPGSAEELASTDESSTFCQARETLPRGTSAIRIWLSADAGPAMTVVVYSHRRAITRGKRGSDWIGTPTIPVKPLPRTVSGVTVCTSFALRDERVIVEGNPTSLAVAAQDGQQALQGRIWIEYLRPGTRSWASLASEVVRHMSLGRAVAGTWIVYLALLLLLLVAALASHLVVRELR